jgi:hypothetical protein
MNVKIKPDVTVEVKFYGVECVSFFHISEEAVREKEAAYEEKRVYCQVCISEGHKKWFLSQLECKN